VLTVAPRWKVPAPRRQGCSTMYPVPAAVLPGSNRFHQDGSMFGAAFREKSKQ
jgi:hypothetical protein